MVGIIPFSKNYEYTSCLSLPPSFLVFSCGIATYTSECTMLISPFSCVHCCNEKYHKLGGLNNRNVFLTVLESGKSETRVPACFSSGEGHPPGSQMLAFLPSYSREQAGRKRRTETGDTSTLTSLLIGSLLLLLSHFSCVRLCATP